ncbi:MAG: endonuclease/exonuclease/phosphatase family protein [Bacteroidota bacterium]|nr:endonuclease/exonuclease/phosphatase family protein [Bacteroidota bacterium]
MNKIGLIRQNQLFQWTISGLIILLSLLFLYPPEILLVKQLSGYTIHWMFFCLLLGLLFLILGLDRLLYVCFICCGVLSLFLLKSYNSNLNLAHFNSLHAVSVLFVNPSLSNDTHDEIISLIEKSHADLVIIEEFTPEWLNLVQALNKNYPYQVEQLRIDPYGKCILSRFPLENKKIIDAKGIPVLIAEMITEGKDRFLIGALNLIPAITMHDYQKLLAFIDVLSNSLTKLNPHQIIAANFNINPWSSELSTFKIKNNLESSRRDNNDGHDEGQLRNIFNVPKNEIYFNKKMECSMLRILHDGHGLAIGIMGRYQLKSSETNN